MATINDYFEQSQFSLAAYALALQAEKMGTEPDFGAVVL